MATELIGRDDAIERIRVFLEASTVDGPQALLLEGEAGIGKSTLWMRGVELARERGLRVLSSRPAEAELELAFAGLGDLFDDVLEEVLPLLPPPRQRALRVALLVEAAQDPLDPRALGVAVRSALEALAELQPLLLAVDDVQWLDGSSAQALAFALRRLRTPLRVLLARRLASPHAPTSLASSLPAPDVERLHVGPLSVGALQAVIQQRFERVFPRPTLLRIHETSGGNPFYALEIARALPRELDPSLPLPVPATLDDLVRARLAALPEPSRHALVLLSAIGEADTATLRRAGAEDALEPAVSQGIVERVADRLRFTHPLLASSVYQGADEATRRDCHVAFAEIVRDPLERARHLALSTQDPDGQIAVVVDEAADLASTQGAAGAAVVLRRQALRLTPVDASDDVRRRTIALVRAQRAAGAPLSSLEPVARDLLSRAAPGLPRAEALLVAAELAPDPRAAVALRRQAVDEAHDDPALQARLHRDLAWDVCLWEGLEAAENHARACLEIAERLPDDKSRAAGLVALSAIRFRMGMPDALRLGETGYGLACMVADTAPPVGDTLWFTSTLIWSSHLERARALLEPLYRDWSARDEAVARQILWQLGCIDLLAGRLETAAELVERSHETSKALLEVDATAQIWARAQIAAWRGDLERARSLILRGRQGRLVTPWFKPHFEAVLAQVELWSGDPEAAVEHFSRAEDSRPVGSREPNLAGWRADYAEALVQVGRTEEAVSLLDTWEAEAAHVERAVVLAQVTRCRGLVAAARGEVEAAATLLERAVGEHAAVGDPLGRARALLALGVARRRERRRGAARDAIEAAVAIFDECGARGWAERARAELGRIGGRTREQGLTPAERRVAALVADGRTNREVAATLVLGERTVETHLTHIYAKLGVRTRTELARVYRTAS